jgi:sulfur-carrier protein adenylyltransferase/sulfurtransferase
MQSSEIKRYHSHIMLDGFGVSGQIKLSKAKVLCVGAGGIASPFLYYLAAAGIGTLAIIDGDTVSVDNLCRQILYTQNDVALKKVDVAKAKLAKLNSEICIEVFDDYLDMANAQALFRRYDLVADCSDNYRTKLIINDVCVAGEQPFVTASARQHKGHFAFFDGKGPCYRCLFDELDVQQEESCHEVGVFSPVLGMLGSLQAIAIIKFLAGYACAFNQLLEIDALTLQQKLFTLQINKNCVLQHHSAVRHEVVPEQQVQFVSCLKSLHRKYQLIDVRSLSEHNQRNLGGECIPLENLATYFAKVSPTECIVLYCQAGKRSQLACEILASMGFKEVYSLVGGVSGACSCCV